MSSTTCIHLTEPPKLSPRSGAIKESLARRQRRENAAARCRVAVLHHQDEQATYSPGGLVDQLRTAQLQAIPIEIPLSDPFVDHYDEWRSKAPPGAYDLAVVVGHLTPPVVAFAVLAGTPILRLSPTLPRPFSSIERAVAAGHVDTIPVAEVSLDGVRRIFASTMRVVSDGPAGVAGHFEPARTATTFWECHIRPVPTSHLPLDVRVDNSRPLRCRNVSIARPGGTFLIELDGRARRLTLAIVNPAPRPLRILS